MCPTRKFQNKRLSVAVVKWSVYAKQNLLHRNELLYQNIGSRGIKTGSHPKEHHEQLTCRGGIAKKNWCGCREEMTTTVYNKVLLY